MPPVSMPALPANYHILLYLRWKIYTPFKTEIVLKIAIFARIKRIYMDESQNIELKRVGVTSISNGN